MEEVENVRRRDFAKLREDVDVGQLFWGRQQRFAASNEVGQPFSVDDRWIGWRWIATATIQYDANATVLNPFPGIEEKGQGM